jgi:ribosomal protein S18 acetylase RimI-like enzyme
MQTTGISADPWLSALFDYPVFQVRPGAAAGGDAGAALTQHARSQPRAFYFAKVGVAEVATVASLSRAGMSVVDVSVTFGIAARSTAPVEVLPAGIDIREARDADSAAVLDIAETSFRYSRFHLDPLIPNRLANRIKREWIASYLARRRGECLWVATVEGRPAAFLAVIGADDQGLRLKIIDLIAVAPSFQKKGIGRALVRFFLARYAASCDRLRVGTQIANVPSCRLYEAAGMTIDRAEYVLHMHVTATAT